MNLEDVIKRSGKSDDGLFETVSGCQKRLAYVGFTSGVQARVSGQEQHVPEQIRPSQRFRENT